MQKSVDRKLACALAVTGLTLGLVSCGVQYTDQELRLLHDPEADEAELLVIYGGVTMDEPAFDSLQRIVELASSRSSPGNGVAGGEETERARALEIVARFMAGRRAISFHDGAVVLDIDELGTMAEAAKGFGELELAEFRPRHLGKAEIDNVAKAVAGWTLTEHGSFLDDRGRLCGFQHFHIQNVTLVVAALEDILIEMLMANEHEGKLLDSSFTQEDEALWRARIASGGAFVALREKELIFDVPLTRGSQERFRRSLLARQGADDDPQRTTFAWLAAHLAGFECHDDRVVLRLKAADGLTLDLRTLGRGCEYDERLLDALRGEGLADPPTLQVDDVRAKIGRK
jgi:hypothetical protein